VTQPGVVTPVEAVRRRVEQVEDRPVRTQQPVRLLDDVLEQLGRLADRRDAGRNLAQRLLRLCLALDLVSRLGATCASLNASGRREKAPIAPNSRSPAASGATTIERRPTSRTKRSVASAWVNDSSAG
jgi:hypothetical protein